PRGGRGACACGGGLHGAPLRGRRPRGAARADRGGGEGTRAGGAEGPLRRHGGDRGTRARLEAAGEYRRGASFLAVRLEVAGCKHIPQGGARKFAAQGKQTNREGGEPRRE